MMKSDNDIKTTEWIIKRFEDLKVVKLLKDEDMKGFVNGYFLGCLDSIDKKKLEDD